MPNLVSIGGVFVEFSAGIRGLHQRGHTPGILWRNFFCGASTLCDNDFSTVRRRIRINLGAVNSCYIPSLLRCLNTGTVLKAAKTKTAFQTGAQTSSEYRARSTESTPTCCGRKGRSKTTENNMQPCDAAGSKRIVPDPEHWGRRQ